MKFFLKQKNKNKRGFTLVETLVALSIFTISVLTMLVLLGQGVSGTTYAKQKIAASYLAEEGIEYVRNLRDTYVLYSGSAQSGWNTFSNTVTLPACAAPNGCYFNADNLFAQSSPMPITKILPTTCNVSACPTILRDTVTGKYVYTAGANTVSSGFVRKITVTQTGTPDEVKVSSQVYWNQGSGVYNITLSETLFNWVE